VVYEDEEPVGLVTIKDLMKWLVEADDKDRVQISDLISVPLITVNVNSSLADALNLMKRFDIKTLGVMQRKKLRGLVTEQGIKEFCDLYPHYLRTFCKYQSRSPA
jgi:CBS domain-containing protein